MIFFEFFLPTVFNAPEGILDLIDFSTKSIQAPAIRESSLKHVERRLSSWAPDPPELNTFFDPPLPPAGNTSSGKKKRER